MDLQVPVYDPCGWLISHVKQHWGIGIKQTVHYQRTHFCTISCAVQKHCNQSFFVWVYPLKDKKCQQSSFFFCSDLGALRKCLVRRTGSVWQVKYKIECSTPQAINNGGAYIWMLESVTSGCSKVSFFLL